MFCHFLNKVGLRSCRGTELAAMKKLLIAQLEVLPVYDPPVACSHSLIREFYASERSVKKLSLSLIHLDLVRFCRETPPALLQKLPLRKRRNCLPFAALPGSSASILHALRCVTEVPSVSDSRE